MTRSTSRSGIAAFAAIALLIVLAVLASGVFGRASDPGTGSPSPSTPPTTGSPTTPPSPDPSDAPAPTPVPSPNEGFAFDLEAPTPHKVSVELDDETDSVTGATSGQPGDGMSVRWFDSIVKNVGDDTIQITWVALPQDDEVHVTVDSVDGKIVVSIDQKAPPANSDALGNDRVMEITFDGPVSAKDVTVVLSR